MNEANPVRRTAALYFFVQGIGILAWWLMLSAYPESKAWFRMGTDDQVLLSFWLPDIVLLATASVATAALLSFDKPLAPPTAWFTTGLISYATFYTFSYALMTDTGWLGVVFMAPATLWSGNFAIGISPFRYGMFRKDPGENTNWILFKTFSQIVVVWGMILGVIPYVLVTLEQKLGIQQIEFPMQTVVGLALFLLASIPGVWSAIVMSREGKGTPLPMDHATEFVVSGPYAFVRNPMAVSGIGQGLVIALLWGSPLVFIYALMGSLIWQLIFRPLEEVDLEKRFGEKFLDYRDKVWCWIPRTTPYQADS